MGIYINGLSFVIDKDLEKMHPMFRYTGRADPEKIGRIDFFPKAYLNLEELTRRFFMKKYMWSSLNARGMNMFKTIENVLKKRRNNWKMNLSKNCGRRENFERLGK